MYLLLVLCNVYLTNNYVMGISAFINFIYVFVNGILKNIPFLSSIQRLKKINVFERENGL